VTKIHQNYMEL